MHIRLVDRSHRCSPPGERVPYDNEDYRRHTNCINASIRKSVAEVSGIEILDLAERLCPKGECEREYNGIVIRADGVHYTIESGAGVSRWVLEQLLK